MQIQAKTNDRIEVIDSLRGFALAGILLAHIIAQQYLASKPPEGFSELIVKNIFDHIAVGIDEILLQGKFFTIFSVLFGLSFYLMMDRAAQRDGSNFSYRFLWRLVILGIIGLVHSLLFRGDILTIYVLLGMLLPLFYHLSNRTLLIFSGLIFLGAGPITYFALTKGASLFSPVSLLEDKVYFEGYYQLVKEGTFFEVVRDNWRNGLPIKMDYQIGILGRGYLTLGYFLVGIVLGRLNVFSQYANLKQLIKKFMWWSLALVPLCLAIMAITFVSASKPINFHTWPIVFIFCTQNLANTALSVFIICLFLILYSGKSHRFFKNFNAYGKMGLTNYVLQSVIGTFIFYGWGLGYIGAIQSGYGLLLGVVIIALQVIGSQWWMKHFYNGPLEYIWRCLTWFTLMPFRRKMISEV